MSTPKYFGLEDKLKFLYDQVGVIDPDFSKCEEIYNLLLEYIEDRC